MIKELWPEMVTACALPNSLSVWEASRFCLDDALAPDARIQVKQALVCALMEFGLKQDVQEMIGVMSDKNWRGCFKDNGWEIEYLGAEKHLDGEAIIAGRMPVSPALLKKLRSATGIQGPVLRPVPPL